MKLVLIKWKDACGVNSDWLFAENDPEELKALTNSSVGWISQESEDAIRIIPQLADDEKQFCGGMTIPK